MLCLAVLVGAILWRLFDHLMKITDPVMLGSLVAVFLAPYGVNRAGSREADIVTSISGLIAKKS
jgi:hypothetical protein